MATIRLKRLFHRNKKCIKLIIDNKQWSDLTFRKRVKSLDILRYTKTFGCWYFENSDSNIRKATDYFKEFAEVIDEASKNKPDIKLFQPMNRKEVESNLNSIEIVKKNELTYKLIDEYRKFLETKRYSVNTVQNYTSCLYQFFAYFKTLHPLECTYKDVQKFQHYLISINKMSVSYQNVMINAIKSFYKFHKTPFLETEEITRPRKPKLLPNFLSPDEISSILRATPNLKHRTMLSVTYGCGLRSGEVLNLKAEDIDARHNQLRINGGKGNKDRFVPISDRMIESLRHYYKYYKPKVYLFEGQGNGVKYSKRSFQLVLKASLKRAGIRKPVTLHWLRHSYATEMMNKGVNLRFIQTILGHKSSKTTEIYTHVTEYAKIKLPHPFDDLDI